MKRIIATLAVTSLTAVAPATALAGKSHAPGHKIKSACGVSFGQLVSAGKSTGTAFHRNYAGGAKAFSADAILAAHGCAVNHR